MPMTITEALAEIKLISNKLEKKRQFVLQNTMKVKQAPDSMAADGGIKQVIQSELQSIADLEDRLCGLRWAIMRTNTTEIIEIMGKVRTLYEWLVWRKEVSNNQKYFYKQIYDVTKNEMDSLAKAPRLYKPNDDSTPTLVEIEPNLDYMSYAAKAATVGEILDKLDGILSLKNATLLVDA